MTSRTDYATSTLGAGYSPADVVDHGSIHASFSGTVRRMAAHGRVTPSVCSVVDSAEILRWADALAPRHGGAAALLSHTSTQLSCDVYCGDGWDARATFYRKGDRLTVTARVTRPGDPRTVTIGVTNIDPVVTAGAPATPVAAHRSGWVRQAVRKLRAGV